MSKHLLVSSRKPPGMAPKMGCLILVLILLLTGHPSAGNASTSSTSVESNSYNALFRQAKPQQQPPTTTTTGGGGGGDGGGDSAGAAAGGAAGGVVAPETGYVHILTDNGQVMEIESEVLDDSALLHRLVAASPVGNLGSIASAARSPSAGTYNTNTNNNNNNNKNYFAPSIRSNTRLIGTAQRIMARRSPDTHFCGDMLVNALSLVCTGRPAKRSRAGSKPETGAAAAASREYDYAGNALNEMLRSTRSMLDNDGESTGNYAGPRLRIKRGVVDECCKKPCSTVTLTHYCETSI